MAIDVAFVIGCSTYDDDSINNLSYPDNDANSISRIFHVICGVPKDNIIILSATSSTRFRPTRNNVIRELAEAQRRKGDIPAIDRLFLFFSGHGVQSETGQDFLLPSDAVVSALEDSALQLDRLKYFIRSWQARTNILLIDACRAVDSSTKSGSSAFSPITPETFRVPGFATVWSCGPGESSYESEKCQRGMFTFALEHAFDQGKCATVYQLDSYLRSELPKLCRQFDRPRQSPFTIVDPIDIQNTIIVSTSKFNEWQTGVPIGKEIRTPVPSRCDLFTEQESLICAFDFGTTYSLVSVFTSLGVHFVPDSDRRTLIPSVVTFLPTRDYFVGRRAVQNATHETNTAVLAIKRKLGRNDLVSLDGCVLSPEVISSLILRSLKTNIEEFTGKGIKFAIVSAPANFTLRQCNSLSQAFELAGIPLIKMVTEPSAASIVLAPHLKSPKHVRVLNETSMDWTTALILDLGGGTLDVCIVVLGDGVFEIEVVTGDCELGGMDYDLAIYNYVIQELSQQFPEVTLLPGELAQLRIEAERAKIQLGLWDSTLVLLHNAEISSGTLYDIEVPITRSKFRELTNLLNKRVRNCIEKALESYSGMWNAESGIDLILLAGQGSRVFTVGEIIAEMFENIPVEDQYQENAVASGAGRYTGVLGGLERGILLLEAYPTSIGVKCSELVGSERDPDCVVSGDSLKNLLTATILKRNTTIPTKKLMRISLEADEGALVRLSFVEVRDVETEELLGNIDVSVGPGVKQLYLTADVDQSRTVLFDIQNDSTQEIQVIQVTNLFRAMDAKVIVDSPLARSSDPERVLPRQTYRILPNKRLD